MKIIAIIVLMQIIIMTIKVILSDSTNSSCNKSFSALDVVVSLFMCNPVGIIPSSKLLI